jgi:RimJ/RimL family protein N-acetyltransferase
MKLTTTRLHIRPVKVDDSKAMFKYRSHAETNEFLSLRPKSENDVKEFIKKTNSQINIEGSWFQFVLIEKNSNSLIGDIGIHFIEDGSDNKQVEIGYTLDKDYRGKGFATEALRVVIDYLFKDLNKHRISASIDPKNSASIKLIERLGFRKEAHFVESLFFHDQWVDDVIYALLSKEWR